tara:strand:+ start:1504 stop:4023 length:2520 start_codon:yes stop_codon:yes gene_type:complete
MAKLPTFQSKKISGSGGAVQMNPVQRSMTTAFRKSANVQASDFYQSAGDQAFASAIQGVGQLANKLKVQKQQAEYEQISQQRSMEFSVFRREMDENPSINSELEAANFADKNRNKYTKSKNKWVSDKLKKDYKLEELELTSRGIITAKNESRRVVINSLQTQEDSVSDSIESGAKTSDLKKKYMETVMTAVSLGNIGKEAAQFRMRQFNQKVSVEDVNIKMNESDTINELNELKTFNKTLLDNKDISTDQYSVINKQIDSRKSEIIKENKEEFYDTFDDVRDLADKGEEFPEELIENFIILFGQNEFNKMLETQEDVSLLNEAKAEKQKNYNILFNQAKKIIDSAIMESLSMTDEASKDFMDGFSAKIKLDFPQLNKEDINNLFKSNTLIRDSFYKQIAVTTASEAVNKGFLENKTKDSIKEDLIATVPAKYIDVSIEQVEKIYDDLKKDFSATYGSRIAKVDFDKFLNTFAQGLAVKDGNITKQSFNKYASNIESNVGYTTDYLTNSQIGQIKDIIDGSFNNPKELIDTVKFIEDFAGDRFNVVADQIADAFGDEEGHIAASLSAIQENLEFGNKQIGNIIHKGSVMYDDVRKGEHKIDFKENFDAVLSSDYYSIYRGNDRVQLAKRIFASVGELDNYSKLSAKQSFDLAFKGMKIIDTGDVKMKIPSKVTNSKGGRDNVDVEKVQESINKITNHLLSNLEMYISVEEIADITNQMPALESSNNITDEIQIEESLGNITKKRRGNREQLAFKQSVKESIVNSLGPDGIMFEWVGENKIAVGYQPDVTSNMQLFKKNGKDFILDLSRMNTETVPKAPARGSYRTTYPKRFSQYIDNITE